MKSSFELIAMIMFLLLAFVWVFKKYFQQKSTNGTQINQPDLPKIWILRPFVYIWWLLIGLWPEHQQQINQSQQPLRFKLLQQGLIWFLLLISVAIIMILFELIAIW
ncbi:MAG: hypothetical protein U9N57_05100 [Pseudomonadota bacterium]|nr:hypothetical protein [Pseudomonadota bacterium]